MHPLKRDLNRAIRNDPKERNHIYRMNPLKSQNRRSRYPLGIALRVARAAPPRGFHNKGGRGVCSPPWHPRLHNTPLLEVCTRAAVSSRLSTSSAGKEAEIGRRKTRDRATRIEFWFGHASTFSLLRSRMKDPRWRCTCHARASNSSLMRLDNLLLFLHSRSTR